MKALLSLILVVLSAQARASAIQFEVLCNTPNLPAATRETIDSMVRYAAGVFTNEQIGCAEAGRRLNAMTSITMRGMTFEYLTVIELSPFALLDNLEELNIPGQKAVYDLTPLKGKKIRALDISHTGVTNLEQLAEFPDLRELNLTITPRSSVWDLRRVRALRSLTIEALNAQGNENSIADMNLQPLRDVYNLESLTIHAAFMRVHGLADLMSVRHLSVSELPVDARQLVKMQLSSLIVNRGTLRNPDALKDLPFITKLKLNAVNLTSLDFVRSLTKLEELSITNNRIRDANPVAGLLELRALDLSNNEIQFLDVLKNLFRLQTLNVANNRLSYTIDVSPLSNLESLDASYNYLMDIQTRDSVLPKLKTMNLNGNRLRAVDFLKASALPAIETLQMDDNRIFKIDAVGALSTLKVLQFDDNRVQDISALINLKSIKRLSARSNLLVNPVCPVTKADACDFLHQGI